MIQFPVIEKKSDFELTPMYTTCEYAGPETSLMPVMTARFALAEDAGLILELYSFEDEPVAGAEDLLDGHVVSAAFRFSPDAPVLQLAADPSGRCLLYEDGVCKGDYPCLLFRGDDERGNYWAIHAELPLSLTGHPVTAVCGNAYKAKLRGAGRHLGSLAPLKDEWDLFSAGNLAPMEVILI